MAAKLPKEYVALLDQYSDEDLAKLADVPVEIVVAAREAAARKLAAAEAKKNPPAEDEPEAEPEVKPEAGAEVLPTLGIIMIEVPEGVDRAKLKAKLDAVVERAAEDAKGSPKVLKYIGDERHLRLRDGKRHQVNFGDVVKGEVAELLWDLARHAVKTVG